MTQFAPARVDGRSDRRVIFELVQDAEPETVFGFDVIEEALQEGIEVEVTKSRIYNAVRQGNRTLLRERRRYLAPIHGQGYRMIRSDEHMAVAISKKSRAESQIKDGIDILKNVRLDEMNESQRTAHLGTLMVLDGVYRVAKASEKRQARFDQVLEDMRRQQAEIAERLAKLEGMDA